MLSDSSLEEELRRLRLENAELRQKLASTSGSGPTNSSPSLVPLPSPVSWTSTAHNLTSYQVERYSRQMLLRSFGAEAQSKLCNASVLVVGAGGLGSPCLLYLAAAGIGRLGVVDKDTVDLSNLHRQTIHREQTVGLHKTESARRAIAEINHTVTVETHPDGLTPANAVALVSQYDLVVDCSDNAPTRYLLSDACVVSSRPLVSGAAIGTDGQLTVYCAGGGCPCYRCLYPEAPLPDNCQRCNEAGVLGVVPGIIGTLQALEAIKLITGKGDALKQRLLIFDALALRFSVMKLRAANAACVACGAAPAITRDGIASYDYRSFTGQDFLEDANESLRVLPRDHRVEATALRDRLVTGECSASAASPSPTTAANPVLDVRPQSQFQLAHLPGSVNVPFERFAEFLHSGAEGRLQSAPGAALDARKPLYVVCRRGNDSQRAVEGLRAAGFDRAVDLVGGLDAWREACDPGFPRY